ncbi:hypothetical protein K503DRAFT_776382 [Rhizopogon vinicolor AM-OR11-026]|uniref:Uncharacterized protein n=1 Tax=Rhizopogon vinicolor AM-OR11-026 TaxID=1314800 RepID=A0A1B7MJC6_9AGAM|nr:hypothetical protein K503DRAFT_776382 [Rhizopogon vinicolor AM-OR11-026]
MTFYFDTPKKSLDNKRPIFRRMVAEAGLTQVQLYNGEEKVWMTYPPTMHDKH